MLRVMEPDSLLVRGLVDNPSRGLSPALDRSTTFDRAPGGASPYGRGHAPVAAEAEALLGALEDAEATVFASGMTAWTCICLTVLGQGKALVIPTSGYYEVELLASNVLGRFGVELRRYDLRDAEGFRRACDGATLAVIETPSNPALAVTDIAEAAAAAHAGGALLCCDNTFATPLLQRPLDLGADLAWQSATKYLAGHSDVLAGVVTTRDTALRERLAWVRRTIGGILAPDPAWLLLRGLRTLHVRLPRQVATAGELARRLASHPAVDAVHYPGLPDHPEHELARRQMPAGAGGVLAFELADGPAAGRCEEAVRLVRNATSLGGVETLIERRARVEPAGRVPEGLLRLAIGLEDVDDLWADLGQAIDVATAQVSAVASATSTAASSPTS
jgi:cystathionine gamma-synthase